LPEAEVRPEPGCEEPATDGIPTCTTGPAGRLAFVVAELRQILSEIRRRREAS